MNVFSTSWNSHAHQSGFSMCEEIRDLGFTHIELSHGLLLSHLPGVIKACELGIIDVAGLHNYCPAPLEAKGDVPDLYQFTSHRSWERKRAIALSKETIDWAARFAADYVVLHLGCIHTLSDQRGTKMLEHEATQGRITSKEYAKLKNQLIEQRNKKSQLYLQRAKEALKELIGYARDKNIKLGIESRSHFEQIPSEIELLSILEEFKDEATIGYWHDFGHIQRKHNLLLLDHQQTLKILSPHLIGVHFNDVIWPAKDHQAPRVTAGVHGVPFDILIPLIDYDRIPISWELSRTVSKEHILRSLHC